MYGAAQASELGAGVPMPEFGIREQAPGSPDSWPDIAVENFFYIDNSDSNATDTGNRFGSPNKPRITLPTGNLAAGSYIEIHGGPYDSSKTIRVNAQGTAARPIWIRGANADQPPAIRQPLQVTGQYVIIEQLHFDKSRRSISIKAGSSYIAIRRNEFSGSGTNDGYTSALGVSGKPGTKTHNIVYLSNEIHDLGDVSPNSPENDYHGIKASRHCSDIWIARNHIYNMGGDSVQLGDSRLTNDERCTNLYISQNDFHSNRENGIDIKNAAKVIVAENSVYDFLPPRSPEAIAIVVHDGADSIWVIDNDIYDSGIGFVNTYATNTWLIGNRIKGIRSAKTTDLESFYGDGVAAHFRGNSSGGLLLNVFTDYSRAVQISGGSNYTIAGNSFIAADTQRSFDIMVKSTGLLEKIDFSFNHFNQFSARVSSSNYDRPAQLSRKSRAEKDKTNEIAEYLRNRTCGNADTDVIDWPDKTFPQDVLESFTRDFNTQLEPDLFRNPCPVKPPAKY